MEGLFRQRASADAGLDEVVRDAAVMGTGARGLRRCSPVNTSCNGRGYGTSVCRRQSDFPACCCMRCPGDAQPVAVSTSLSRRVRLSAPEASSADEPLGAFTSNLAAPRVEHWRQLGRPLVVGAGRHGSPIVLPRRGRCDLCSFRDSHRREPPRSSVAGGALARHRRSNNGVQWWSPAGCR
jgi:hypothetical protein